MPLSMKSSKYALWPFRRVDHPRGVNLSLVTNIDFNHIYPSINPPGVEGIPKGSVFISALWPLGNALTPYQPHLRPLRAEWAPFYLWEGLFIIRGGGIKG